MNDLFRLTNKLSYYDKTHNLYQLMEYYTTPSRQLLLVQLHPTTITSTPTDNYQHPPPHPSIKPSQDNYILYVYVSVCMCVP